MKSRTKKITIGITIAVIIILILIIYFIISQIVYCKLNKADLDPTNNPNYISCLENSDCIPTSCGCLNKEGAKKFDTTANKCGVELRCIWPSNCTCKNNQCYSDYGRELL